MNSLSGNGAAKEPGAPPSLFRLRVRDGAVEPRATVGSGDAFLAGFVAARYSGSGNEDCLRFAVACGAESTQHFGAGVLNAREVDRLLSEVAVESLETPAVQPSP